MVRYLIITEIRIQSEFAYITNGNLVGGFRMNVGIFRPQSEGITNRYVEKIENTSLVHDASIRNVPKYRVMPSEFRCPVHFIRYSSITYVYTDYCTRFGFGRGRLCPKSSSGNFGREVGWTFTHFVPEPTGRVPSSPSKAK